MANRHSNLKVSVVEFRDRPHYQMQWVDPMTGRKKTRSTKVERTGRKSERTQAERVAAKFEAELREGRYHDPCNVTWEDFREKYETEVLTGLAENTDRKVGSVFNLVEKILSPQRLRDLTADRISYLQSELRKGGRSEDTIKGYMAHLKAALSSAVDWGMLLSVPKISMPKRAKGVSRAKGRPITTEEFERLLAKVPEVVGPRAAPSWTHYLHGLWLSGPKTGRVLETLLGPRRPPLY